MKKKRRHRTAEEMYPLISAWYNSGQTRKDYCASHQLGLHLFAYWHSKYKQSQALSTPQLETSKDFVRLEVPDAPLSKTIKIHYANGNHLVLPCELDLNLLTSLVKIVCHV